MAEGFLTKQAPLLGSSRLGLALIGCIGMIVIYASRINLSVSLVCMLNGTAIDEQRLEEENETARQPECSREETNSLTLQLMNSSKNLAAKEKLEGDIIWSKKVQGLVLGSFFWGYLFTQILGGMAAQWIGAKRILGACMLITCIMTIFSPEGAKFGYVAFMVIRIILGISQGVVFPAFHTMWGNWAPPLETSMLTGLTYAGAQLGNVITLPVSGALCKYGFGGGWPSIFYTIGIVAFLWLVVWMFYASDSPAQHKRISETEKLYIMSSVSHDRSAMKGIEKMAVPWRKILISMPFWAAVVGHWAADWGAYIMLTCLPSFMSEVLGFDVTTLGFLASIPYILYFICINISGFAADYLRRHSILSTRNTRRLMMTIALGSQAVLLVAASYCPCGQEYLVVALLAIGTGLSGFQYAGFIVNYMDIGPAYAGPTLGVGNTLSCISGILAPYAMGVMTPNKLRKEWQGLFWLTFAILIGGLIFFNIFASGEIQPWAHIADNKDNEEDDEKMREMTEVTAESDASTLPADSATAALV